MSYLQRRNGRYRARYRGPARPGTSNTFDRKADALRFLAKMETEKARGSWIDPRHTDLPLARWSEEFRVGPPALAEDVGDLPQGPK